MTEFALTTDWLATRAAVSPDAQALFFEGESWTFGELDALASLADSWLNQLGVCVGAHVGVLLPNCPAMVVLIFALARRGAVMVPLNTRLQVAEIAWQVTKSDCSYVVTTADLAPILQTNKLVKVAVVDEQLQWLHGDEMPEAATRVIAEGSMDQVQAIVFTSGTTGMPKGAMLTYSNHFYNAIGSAFRLGILPTDRWMACMPLYHVGGLAIVLRSCLYGTALVLQKGFDIEAVSSSLEYDNVSIASLVPTMLRRLLDTADPHRWPSLRLILLGGAAAPVELLEKARSAGVPVVPTYGLTEASSQVATLRPDQINLKPGSVGKPLMFGRMRIVDDAEQTVGVDVVGEICLRSPGVFQGYYDDDAATAATLHHGELHTGDMGYLDADGDLWVVQRRSDLIVTGGENVYPVEVEQALLGHPAVVDVCVIGVSDIEWGQRVAALVVTRHPVTEEELIAFAHEQLAGYKIPRLLKFVEELPLTGSGKVSRAEAAMLLQQEVIES